MKLRIFVLACVALIAGAASAKAQQEVKIGALYPLSGPTAQIGIDAVAAIRTAVEIVNEGADLPLTLAKNKGLPGVGGAKVTIIVVDHQGKPEVGQSEAERLITQEKVHAVFGAYFSSVTAASSQAAERAGIPFVNADATQPALTQRGLKYFFRTTPTDETFSELMFDFLKDFGAKSSQKFQSVSIFHEDTAYGTDSAKVQERLAKERGLRVLEKIAYKAQTTSLTAEVQRLKAANADVLMPSSYTSDTFLLLRTAKDLDYNPKLIVCPERRVYRPNVYQHNGQGRRGRDHPVSLQRRPRRPHPAACEDQYHLQEAFEWTRSFGCSGSRLHGLHDAARCDQPGRLHGPREDSRRACGDQYPGRSTDRALPRRQV
jgi:branched-chain amino acid transport system substrate-binding protein